MNIQYKKDKWNGYDMLVFDLNDREVKLVCPREPRNDKKWLLKTEYMNAFPRFEIEMLSRGYYVANIENITRWCKPEDTDARAELCEFLASEHNFCEKCVPVGLSCGGMQAVYFAAKYPGYVAALYLDAPVLNLLSCPCDLGMATSNLYASYFKHMGVTVSELLNFRNHPIDVADAIIMEGIPTILICGDSDHTVPYEENGMILAEKYRKTNIPFKEIIKKNCDHHPHSLEDPRPIIEFIERYY